MNNPLHLLSEDDRDSTLLDFCEGSLPADQALLIQEHLKDCSACRAAVKAHRAYQHMILPVLDLDHQPVATLEHKIKKALAAERQKDGQQPPLPAKTRLLPLFSLRRSFAYTAAAVVLVAAAIFVQSPAFSTLEPQQFSDAKEENQALTEQASLMAAAEPAVKAADQAVPSTDPQPQPRIMMAKEAVSAPAEAYLDVWTSQNPLPIIDSQNDAAGLSAADLTPHAVQAIWIEPNLYIAAIPADQIDSDFTQLEQRIPHFLPQCRIIKENELALQTRLNSQFDSDTVKELLSRLIVPDTAYIVLITGG